MGIDHEEEAAFPRHSRALFEEYARTREVEVRNHLVECHQRLVRHLVKRFAPVPGAAREDLLQVGFIGLIQAIERYDPYCGIEFFAFAAPTIVGVIKHFLRDHTWAAKVPRRLREFSTSIRGIRARLEQEIGRPPTITELAVAAGVSEDQVIQAMEVDLYHRHDSLDWLLRSPEDGAATPTRDPSGTADPRYREIEDREAIRAAMRLLEPRSQMILELRFFAGATQSAVAKQLGISQMHVSRLEREALRRLRKLLWP